LFHRDIKTSTETRFDVKSCFFLQKINDNVTQECALIGQFVPMIALTGRFGSDMQADSNAGVGIT
jgi:hypothetical protein